MIYKRLKFKRATMKDAVSLYNWKNESETRKNSIVSHDPIKFENHLVWLKEKLEDPKIEIYIIMSKDQKLGDIRFEIGRYIEVAIKIDKHFRNKGIASLTVQTVAAEVQSRFKRKMIAKIVDGNIPSMRVFLKNGFKLTKYTKPTEQGYYFLERPYSCN